MINIIFIGALSTGQKVLDYLSSNKHVKIVATITKPISKSNFNLDLNQLSDGSLEKIYDLNANNYIDKIKKISPDLIIVAGWSGLLSKELIEIPNLGTIGFHPSLLPKDRGRSVLAWQIEEGYRETALTMFYYNELPDCGDIIAQEKIKIENNDYISDVLEKCDQAAHNLMYAYFPMIRKGIEIRKPQKISEGNFRRLRNDNDSIIDWNKNGEVTYNKIRAISTPYPGAYFLHKNEKIRVWKAVFIKDKTAPHISLKNEKIGSLQKISDKTYTARCRNGIIEFIVEEDFNV
jgi:methionyl-tRNA formyltransferase